jgi:hypothetical protein
MRSYEISSDFSSFRLCTNARLNLELLPGTQPPNIVRYI